MANKQSVAEARKSLPRLVRQVESGKSVELTRRGTRKINRKELAINPKEIFGGTRDEVRGREVDLRV
jgi:hypothetical protein